MKITREGNELVIRVSLKGKRHSGEEMDNIIAVYENNDCNGLSYRIDMSYKGKLDQFTDYFLRLDVPKKELETLAKKLNIDVFYYYEDNNSHKSTQEVR